MVQCFGLQYVILALPSMKFLFVIVVVLIIFTCFEHEIINNYKCTNVYGLLSLVNLKLSITSAHCNITECHVP